MADDVASKVKKIVADHLGIEEAGPASRRDSESHRDDEGSALEGGRQVAGV